LSPNDMFMEKFKLKRNPLINMSPFPLSSAPFVGALTKSKAKVWIWTYTVSFLCEFEYVYFEILLYIAR
jgi:hypothetical protein